MFIINIFTSMVCTLIGVFVGYRSAKLNYRYDKEIAFLKGYLQAHKDILKKLEQNLKK